MSAARIYPFEVPQEVLEFQQKVQEAVDTIATYTVLLVDDIFASRVNVDEFRASLNREREVNANPSALELEVGKIVNLTTAMLFQQIVDDYRGKPQAVVFIHHHELIYANMQRRARPHIKSLATYLDAHPEAKNLIFTQQ